MTAFTSLDLDVGEYKNVAVLVHVVPDIDPYDPANIPSLLALE